MKYLSTSITLITFIIFSSSDLFAQQVFDLNSIDTRSKQAAEKTISGAEQQRLYYTLHDDQISFSDIKSGDFVRMEISPGVLSSFKVNRVAKYTSNTTSFIVESTENPENTFTFTYSDGMLHGIFHKSHEDVYFFEYDQFNRQNYVAKSASFYDDEQFCSIHEIDHAVLDFDYPHLLELRAKSSSKHHARTHIPNITAMSSSVDEEAVIDIMIPYTENARLWAESVSYNSIENVISLSLALSQTALDNSNTNVTLRLVHYYQTDYSNDSLENLSSSDPDYVSAADHLRRLTLDESNPYDFCRNSNCQLSDFDGFFNDVHELRNQYGADLVAAILSEPNTGGIAWRNASTAGFSILGFSINRVQQIAAGYTLIHEIGHNMGNAHARNQPTAEADAFGGIFVYSSGNRFTVDDKNYATVMAYDAGGYTEIPYFSSPDIIYNGAPTGNPITFNSDGGPADNARSMREIKRVIASYRPSVIDAPVVEVDVSSINASLDQDNNVAVVPVIIQNNGESELMWDLDFDIESGPLSRKESVQSSDSDVAKPVSYSEISGNSGSVSFTTSDDPGIIFSTSFEPIEGFSSGNFATRVGWRAISESAPFEISADRPSDGVRHLRLPRRSESSSSTTARSPFFGPQAMGEFSLSFDLAIQDQIFDGTGEQFDIKVYDGSNGLLSSGITVFGENIFVRSEDEQGNSGFIDTGFNFTNDSNYGSFQILYKPDKRTIDYFLNDELLESTPYLKGKKPDYIHFGQLNDVNGAYLDVDNVVVERVFSPFSWLKIEDFAGIVAPGESQVVNLTLSAVNVATGSYQSILKIRSNDPSNPVIEVPISATIEMSTSTQNEPEVPFSTELLQNYPNPFNPSTTIQFSLNRASDVTLEVFNITGQRVATLVNETLSAGSHQHSFDASGLSSGIYIYRLRTPDQMLTRQMILIK